MKNIKKLLNKKDFPKNNDCINKLIGNKKIILYGAGEGFITFSVFVIERYNLKVTLILDRKYDYGSNNFGIKCISPDYYKPTLEEKNESVVIITVGKSEYHKEICDCLKGMGFKNIIFSSDIYEYHLLCPTEELKERGYKFYHTNKKNILLCPSLFADALSRDIYLKIVKTHLQRKIVPIPNRNPKEQYFPTDVNLQKGFSRFINCGSYNGDTIKNLLNLKKKIKALACFEPDPGNFKTLTDYLVQNKDKIADNIIAFPCGVYSVEKQFKFSSGNEFNSMISKEGASIIQCVSIDHVIPSFDPTFINMDIEGAELEALKGAEGTIVESKPDLAICVYHAPNHIWDIPLYLDGLRLGYQFYLRNYTSFVSETILYATVSRNK